MCFFTKHYIVFYQFQGEKNTDPITLSNSFINYSPAQFLIDLSSRNPENRYLIKWFEKISKKDFIMLSNYFKEREQKGDLLD